MEKKKTKIKTKKIKKPVKVNTKKPKIVLVKKNIKKLVKKITSKKPIPEKKLEKITKPKIKKIPSNAKQENPTSDGLFKAKIRVVGIGGGGGSIVSEIGRSLEKASFVVADTDVRALKKRPGIKYFWFGEELTHGLGTGVNVELAKQAGEQAKEKISDIFKDQDIVIFIASLGGGLGSGATQIFAQEAKKFGGITFGIFTLPFRFEGKNKSRIAQTALKNLRQSLNVSLTIPNEKIFKVISANTPITEAFSKVNKSLIGSLESLIDLIYTPGIINIDFADLRTILSGIGNSAFLNTVEESGKDRAEKICKNIVSNPLLQNNNFVSEKILFNIAGSENLSMLEVEKISRHIGEQNPKAKIIFGISKNSKLKNKIKTTILMTGGGTKAEPKPSLILDKPEEKKDVVKDIVAEKEIKLKIIDKKPEKVVETKKKTEKPAKNLVKKPKNKAKKQEKQKDKKPVLVPNFQPQVVASSDVNQRKVNVAEAIALPAKKAIRRSGLEIKKEEELEEKKRIAQEKEWEIPAFLRRVKFNK
jgi:cell division protein FtsZ